MDWPTLITTILAETPLPAPPSPELGPGLVPSPEATTLTPSPSATLEAATGKDANAGVPQWVAFGTAIVAALAAIGASALTQVLAARYEGQRRNDQYQREDMQRRRDELKQVYSDLIRNLDEYALTVLLHKGAKPVIDGLAELSHDTPGREGLMTRHEGLGDKMVALAAAVGSGLGLVQLLGESAVYQAGVECFGFLKDVKPGDGTMKTKGNQLNQKLKKAMQDSLANYGPKPAKASAGG